MAGKKVIEMLYEDNDLLDEDDELLCEMRSIEAFFLEDLASSSVGSDQVAMSSVLKNICLVLHRGEERLQEIIDNAEEMSDEEYFKKFRVTKKTFDFLLKKFKQDAPTSHAGQTPLDPKVSLMIALRYLGSNCSFTDLKDEFGIALSCAFRAVYNVLKKFTDVSSEFIGWPSAEEFIYEENYYKNNYGLEGVVGVVGNCNIKIKAPKADSANYFDEATSTYNTHLLAVCNANMKFTYICTGFPGSLSSYEVLNSSDLGFKLNNDTDALSITRNNHLVANSAFPLKEYLMVPFRDDGRLTRGQMIFNNSIYKVANVLETAFQWLKYRFKRLHFVSAEDQQRSSLIIAAACIIHNITLDSELEKQLLINEISLEMPKEQNIFSERIDITHGLEDRSSLAFRKRNNLVKIFQ